MFSGVFGEFLQRVQAPALAASARLAERLDFPNLARRVLLNQWQVIQASEDLIRLALELCDQGLDEYFERKRRDEAGHANLMRQDLERLGITTSQPTDPNIAAMVGSQYFHILQGETSSFLGYIGLLEWSPPQLEEIERFEDMAHIQRGTLKCARLHSDADVGHREDLAKVLDELPEELHPGVLSNAAHSSLFQTLALESLLRHPETETRASP